MIDYQKTVSALKYAHRIIKSHNDYGVSFGELDHDGLLHSFCLSRYDNSLEPQIRIVLEYLASEKMFDDSEILRACEDRFKKLLV